jgi:penicillin-binding protein 1C
VWLRCGPLPARLLDASAARADPSTIVLDRNGEVLSEARSSIGTRTETLAADEIPLLLEHATLAAEDHRFYRHPGLDPAAMARALIRNARALQVVEGGSTITQQVAKLLMARADGHRTEGWNGKLREAVIALRLEHRFSKREILALYLNLAPYGNQISGIQRASRAYFGRDVATLTPAEAALLAALPQRPSRFNPWKSASASGVPVSAVTARQRRILDRMRTLDWLTPEEYRIARAERVAVTRERREALAPHFVERVLAVLAEAPSRPERVLSTLDAVLQREVRGIIDARREDLKRHQATNVAVGVLDNRTGEWLAWEGSGDYFDQDNGGAIDGMMAPRQPGSALKPFTYAAAFERGYDPARVLADVPSQFPTAEPGVLYRPRNYDDQFRGPLLARAALAGSENVPAVAVADDIGVPAILRLLRDAGFSTLDSNAAHYGLGITLGNAEVRLSDLIAAYAMFARGGVALNPSLLRRDSPSAPLHRLVSERTAFWITDILSDDEARAFVFGRGGSLEFPFTVAAKTGTSQAYHDNWAVGFTREITVGVWVGNFNRRPLVGSSGVTGAGPIFHDVMLAAVERVRGSIPAGDRTPVITAPTDVRQRTVCAVSGLAPTSACLRRTSEWLPIDASLQTCTWHRETSTGVVTIWPEAYRAWSRSSATAPVDAEVSAPPARHPTVSASSAAFEIVSPLAGATFLRDPTLRPEFQTLSLRSRGSQGRIEWRVDDAVLASAAGDESVRWPLAPGAHAIEARDGAGHVARVTVTVR